MPQVGLNGLWTEGWLPTQIERRRSVEISCAFAPRVGRVEARLVREQHCFVERSFHECAELRDAIPLPLMPLVSIRMSNDVGVTIPK